MLFAAAHALTGGCLPDLQGIETGQEGAKAKPTLSGLLRPRGVAPLKEARCHFPPPADCAVRGHTEVAPPLA
ncbi:MAG: hypothetical protein ACPH5G_03780, partial [Pseudooceanicola atlanticus]